MNNDDFFDDYMLLHNPNAAPAGVLRAPRVFRERINHQFPDDQDWKHHIRFRFNNAMLEYLEGEIGEMLVSATLRNHALSVRECQFQTSFYANLFINADSFHAVSALSRAAGVDVGRSPVERRRLPRPISVNGVTSSAQSRQCRQRSDLRPHHRLSRDRC